VTRGESTPRFERSFAEPFFRLKKRGGPDPAVVRFRREPSGRRSKKMNVWPQDRAGEFFMQLFRRRFR